MLKVFFFTQILIGRLQSVLHSLIAACLSSAVKLARRHRVEKECGPRECGKKLEHRAARSQRGGSAVVEFDHFSLLFLYTIL